MSRPGLQANEVKLVRLRKTEPSVRAVYAGKPRTEPQTGQGTPAFRELLPSPERAVEARRRFQVRTRWCGELYATIGGGRCTTQGNCLSESVSRNLSYFIYGMVTWNRPGLRFCVSAKPITTNSHNWPNYVTMECAALIYFEMRLKQFEIVKWGRVMTSTR